MSLNKWNPFRFSRRNGGSQSRGMSQQRGSQQQQQGEVAASSGQQMGAGTGMGGGTGANTGGGGGMPQVWLDPRGLPDPMRMMASMFTDPFGAMSRLDSFFGDFSPAAFEPRIDVSDRGDAILITAELPGVDQDDIEVTLEDEYLMISGEKKLEREDEERGVYRVERAFGRFQRVIPLPDGVDPTRAEASYENGTLTIRLPKAAGESGGRRLDIGRGSTGGVRASASGASASGASGTTATGGARGSRSSQQG